MEKIIIEVGSTNTKIDLYDGEDVKHIATETIEFKRNYKEQNELNSSDVKKLINIVKEYKSKYTNIYVCGTSIFRTLTNKQREDFLKLFLNETGIEFEIISQEQETELTVYGTAKNINRRVAVFVGGGGSVEIAIYENGIKEMVNTPFGAMDVMHKYPDLAEDIATTSLDDVQKYIKENVKLPEEKADILILAGGAHKYFALESGISYEKNSLYTDKLQPIMMDIDTRKNDTYRYYKEISLDNIRNRVKDPKWWFGTRAMCALGLTVAEEIGAKYIIPTDIGVVYGLLEK